LVSAQWPADETAVALASDPDGRLILLTWTAQGDAHIWLLGPGGTLTGPTTLIGAARPYSVAWVDTDRIAVLLPNVPTEAPVYPISPSATDVLPVGDLYPLRLHDGGAFAHSVALPPQYMSGGYPQPLYNLSLPSFSVQGEASNESLLDSGTTTTIWHRLYLEAAIPAHTSIRVFLAAGDEAIPPADTHDWHEHRFGEFFSPGNGDGIPWAAWVSSPSEIPFHPGLLPCPRERDRAGLFTVLIQRSNRPVRSLRGRYLWVRVLLASEGRSTPQIFALRAYGSRFSYRDAYLPALYCETLFGADADQLIGSDQLTTPADFLERFLDNFEGILTPLEDRIASAYLLTDPRSARDEALEWLGSWLGIGFDPAYPSDRRRALLAATPELCRRRGTARGLTQALDIATAGAVSGGSIVVLEDFRLRRVIATILGADLTVQDPLLAGIVTSDNSYVGDTLFLGDEEQQEFLAMFGNALPLNTSEEAAVTAFFDALANRVTVLVHNEVTPQDLGLIGRVVAMETPAHVLSRVVTATYPFVVGMASLVGVDTYLGPRREPQPVELGRSQLGAGDLAEHAPSLDPRLGGGWITIAGPKGVPPVADPGPAITVPFGASFRLDASRSHGQSGMSLKDYIWTMLS
jgi:phage tail-like protein